MKAAEKRFLATRNPVDTGMHFLVEARVRHDMLMDSDVRLQGRMEQLTERMDRLTERMDRLAESQDRTAAAVRELAVAHAATEKSLKKFIDSMRRPGGNGAH